MCKLTVTNRLWPRGHVWQSVLCREKRKLKESCWSLLALEFQTLEFRRSLYVSRSNMLARKDKPKAFFIVLTARPRVHSVLFLFCI